MDAPIARLICLRHAESANVTGRQAGAMPDAPLTARGRKQAIVDGDLAARVADGESGHDVAARVTAALTQVAAASTNRPAIVIGHVASLTAGISALCRDGPALWGTPLPHAVPFPLTRHGARWHVQWPAAEER